MSLDFEFREDDNDLTITKYIGDSESVEIPIIINNKYITKIAKNAFSNCKNLKSIEISNFITEIESGAFSNCNNLTNVKCYSDAVVNCIFEDFIPYDLIHNFISNNFDKFNIANKETLCLYFITEIPDKINYYVSNYLFEQKYYFIEKCINDKNVTGLKTTIDLFDYTIRYIEKCISLAKDINDSEISDILFAEKKRLNKKPYNTNRMKKFWNYHSTRNIGITLNEYICKETDVDIPAYIGKTSVINLSKYVFSFTNAYIKTIHVPSSIKTIDPYAISQCNHLVDVNVSEDNHFFSSQDGILFNKPMNQILKLPIGRNETTYKISDSITEISAFAFAGCSSLTNVEIPNSVTSIGDYAFSGCTGLTTIEIPSSVTELGSNTFENCVNLTTIKCLSNSVVNKIFKPCIPNNLLHNFISNDFKMLSNLNKENMFFYFIINMPDKITSDFSNYFKRKKEFFIEKIINEKNTKALQTALTLFTPTVLDIEKYIKFAEVHKDAEINSILLEESKKFTTEDKYKAKDKELNRELNKKTNSVAEMKKLWKYTSIKGSLILNAYIGSDKNIVIPSLIGRTPVTTIHKGAFLGGIELTNIEIPNSITKIDNYAFAGCTGLTNIEIPISVTEIGIGAFERCANLTNIKIPNSITRIDWSAFRGCTRLTSIEIPNSVTYIGQNAFKGCISLANIKIPISVTVIDKGAFNECTNLTNIKIPNFVTKIDISVFEGCTKLTNVEIPNSITEINRNAFAECTALTNIKIPDSVTSIGNYAFYECTGLANIEIPNSVTEIAKNAFPECTVIHRL